MLKLGDKVKVQPVTFGKPNVKRTGTVVYIHPTGRWYTLEFKAKNTEAKLYESFLYGRA